MKNWLKAMALLGLVTGPPLVLNMPPARSPLFIPEFVDGLDGATAFGPPFGVALIAWALLTFVAASAGRRVALAVSMRTAIALGLWAVRLAGPFWFELASVTVAIGLAGVCLPATVLLSGPFVRGAR